MGKPVQTFIRRILGRKTQRVVDGQVVDVTDRDGNVRRFWTLVFEYLRDNDVVERKVNVFPNIFSGGRDGETMFWKRQDLQGLVNQIQAIQPGQKVELEEKIPATVQYDGKWWNLTDIGREGTPATEAAPVPQQDAQVQKNTEDIQEIKGDLKTILQMLQQQQQN